MEPMPRSAPDIFLVGSDSLQASDESRRDRSGTDQRAPGCQHIIEDLAASFEFGEAYMGESTNS